MRIVHSTIRYPPARGGVESHVQTMVESLVDAGHDLTVVTSDLSQHLPGMQRPLSDAERAEDASRSYTVSRQRSFTVPRLDAYPVLLGAPKAIWTAEPDVIHAHCFYYASADSAASVAKLRRTPLVLSPHLPARTGTKWRAIRKLMGWVVSKADVLTTLTEFERDFLIRSGFDVGPTTLLPPAVRPFAPEPGPPPSIADWATDPNVRIVQYMARITDAKGADTLIAAAPAVCRAHPDVRFALAGPIGDDDRARYGREIEALGLSDHIRLIGEVTDAEREQLYGAASVFVFPSRYEAYGIVALEAMSAGVPVVAADAAAIPEVLQHGRLGVLHRAGDVDSLATELTKLLGDEARMAELGQIGRAHIAEHHTMEALRGRLELAYAQAAEERRGR